MLEEGLGGLLGIVEPQENQIAAEYRVAGAQIDGAAVINHGFVHASDGAESIAEIIQGGRRAGSQLDGAAGLGDGVIEPIRGHQGVGEIVVSRGEIGTNLNRPAGGGYGLLVSIHHPEGIAKIAPCLDIIRANLDGAAEKIDRVVESALQFLGVSEIVKCWRRNPGWRLSPN